MRTHLGLAALVLSSLALGTLGGCVNDQSSSAAADRSKIKQNLTPELLTTNETHLQAENRLLLTFNTNMRLFWADMARVWYIDRPSRLTPDPMPH